MSEFYPDVRDEDGIEGAEGFLLVNAILLAAIMLSALFCFFAAWRFMQRKGLGALSDANLGKVFGWGGQPVRRHSRAPSFSGTARSTLAS